MNTAFNILILIYSCFMLLGLFLQYHLGKKVESSRREIGWMKFLFFNLIILGLLISFETIPNSIPIVYSLIVLGGLTELVCITQKNTFPVRITILTICLGIFCLFINSAIQLESLTILEILLLVAIFDGYSQLGGKWTGKTKLAPSISPNKTWEGFSIGLCAVYLAGLVIYLITDETVITFFFFLPFLALFGDLFASAIKRKAKVKDFSQLIPYQGGFLDRFDSYIFTVSITSLIFIL